MEILYTILTLYLIGSYFVSALFIKDWIFEPEKLPAKETSKRLALILGMPIWILVTGYLVATDKFFKK